MLASASSATSWESIEALLLDYNSSFPPRPLNIDAECVCPILTHSQPVDCE